MTIENSTESAEAAQAHGQVIDSHKEQLMTHTSQLDPQDLQKLNGTVQESKQAIENTGKTCKTYGDNVSKMSDIDKSSGDAFSSASKNSALTREVGNVPSPSQAQGPQFDSKQAMGVAGQVMQTASQAASNNPLSQALQGGGQGGPLGQVGQMLTQLSSGMMGGGSQTGQPVSDMGNAQAENARKENNGSIRAGSQPENDRERKALEVMEAEKGTPYAWGAGSPTGPTLGQSDGGGAADACGDSEKMGYDCSGWAQHVTYESTGETIPKYSGDQYSQGTPVTFPRIGDLVFPTDEFDDNGVPQHVQVYAGKDENGVDIVSEAPHSGATVQYSPMGNAEFRTFADPSQDDLELAS